MERSKTVIKAAEELWKYSNCYRGFRSIPGLAIYSGEVYYALSWIERVIVSDEELVRIDVNIGLNRYSLISKKKKMIELLKYVLDLPWR